MGHGDGLVRKKDDVKDDAITKAKLLGNRMQ